MRFTGQVVTANLLVLTAVAAGAVAAAQEPRYPAPPSAPKAVAADKADKVVAAKPTLEATLVDPEKNGKRGSATVKADVQGLKMTDPASVNEKPETGQGHLHYQLDDGPIIATTSTKLSFHGLKPGKHAVKVMLAANDHSPLGVEKALTVEVGGSGYGH